MTLKETNNFVISQETLNNVLEKYRKAWMEELAKVEKLVEYAVIERRSLPDNYWLPAHRAASRYHTAKLFADSIRLAMEEM